MSPFDWYKSLPKWKRAAFLIACRILGNGNAFRTFSYGKWAESEVRHA